MDAQSRRKRRRSICPRDTTSWDCFESLEWTNDAGAQHCLTSTRSAGSPDDEPPVTAGGMITAPVGRRSRATSPGAPAEAYFFFFLAACFGPYFFLAARTQASRLCL